MLTHYNIFRSTADSFTQALTEVLSWVDNRFVPLRFVFFGNPLSCEQYAVEHYRLSQAVFDKYGLNAPVISYVAQTPLAATLVMEVQMIEPGPLVEYHISQSGHRYLTVDTILGRMLYTEGLGSVDLGQSARSQSKEIFASLSSILFDEGFGVNDIVRQWNYIADITSVGGEGQNYQQFNDARTDFYSTVDWGGGYPAATGIGTNVGGVVVEVDAVKVSGGRVVSLDNSLQVAAHEYSREVLLGTEQLSTPKFERAKALVSDSMSVMLYISGTAAIRGEVSLSDVGIKEQTIATIENIEYLVGRENLEKHQIYTPKELEIGLFRVYLKHRSHYMAARDILSRRYPNTPALYVLSDVCRDELLIEIEGIADNF